MAEPLPDTHRTPIALSERDIAARLHSSSDGSKARGEIHMLYATWTPTAGADECYIIDLGSLPKGAILIPHLSAIWGLYDGIGDITLNLCTNALAAKNTELAVDNNTFTNVATLDYVDTAAADNKNWTFYGPPVAIASVDNHLYLVEPTEAENFNQIDTGTLHVMVAYRY